MDEPYDGDCCPECDWGYDDLDDAPEDDEPGLNLAWEIPMPHPPPNRGTRLGASPYRVVVETDSHGSLVRRAEVWEGDDGSRRHEALVWAADFTTDPTVAVTGADWVDDSGNALIRGLAASVLVTQADVLALTWPEEPWRGGDDSR